MSITACTARLKVPVYLLYTLHIASKLVGHYI